MNAIMPTPPSVEPTADNNGFVNPLDTPVEAVWKTLTSLVEQAVNDIETQTAAAIRRREIAMAFKAIRNLKAEVDKAVANADVGMVREITLLYLDGVRDALIENFRLINPKAGDDKITQIVDRFLEDARGKLSPSPTPVVGDGKRKKR